MSRVSKQSKLLKQQKIQRRFEQTYKRLEYCNSKKLEEFLKNGYAQDKFDKDWDKEGEIFRLSSTDRLAIHKLIQLKKYQEKNK